MKYLCEHCGSSYFQEAQATDCEQGHVEKKTPGTSLVRNRRIASFECSRLIHLELWECANGGRTEFVIWERNMEVSGDGYYGGRYFECWEGNVESAVYMAAVECFGEKCKIFKGEHYAQKRIDASREAKVETT